MCSPPPASGRAIADFLMQYVKKDKLTELLAEKLCARLAASESTRQARAVSYCLGQLKVRSMCSLFFVFFSLEYLFRFSASGLGGSVSVMYPESMLSFEKWGCQGLTCRLMTARPPTHDDK